MAELPQTYKLSDAERKHLDEHGFLVIKELIDLSTLNSCKQRFSQICNGVVRRGSMLIVKEPSLKAKGATGEDLINKAQEVHYDDVFSLYTEHPRLLDVMSQLVGEDVSVVHSMLINKPPGTGRHPPHQDYFYFPIRPVECIMGSWTAIDHVNLENGCLYVIPGSHKAQTLHEHSEAPNSSRLYHLILDEEAVAPLDKRVDLEMAPGDTLIFHPLLVHGSRPNATKGYRKAISAHYASSHCHFVEGHPLAKEVEAVGRKRGIHVSYADLWLYKSKHVRGVNSKL